jgi:hypothetical protein
LEPGLHGDVWYDLSSMDDDADLETPRESDTVGLHIMMAIFGEISLGRYTVNVNYKTCEILLTEL